MTQSLSLVQLKIPILETLTAERYLACFLHEMGKKRLAKYEAYLTDQEIDRGQKLMERVSSLVDKVNLATSDPRDDKLTSMKILSGMRGLPCGDLCCL